MLSADVIRNNDEARFELEQTYPKAAQVWRFRNVKSWEARAASAVVHVLGASAKGALGFAQRALARFRAKAALKPVREQWSH